MLRKKPLEKSFLDFKKWVKSIQTAGYNGARTVLANCSAANDEYIEQQPEEIRDFLGEKVRLATVHWTCNRCHRDVLLLCLSWRLSTC